MGLGGISVDPFAGLGDLPISPPAPPRVIYDPFAPLPGSADGIFAGGGAAGIRSLPFGTGDRTFSDLASPSQAKIAGLCRKVGVVFIVTGHTPHRAITVYGKRIFDIDVGMTPAYDENMPQALVFGRNGIVGLRADGTGKELVRFGASSA